MTLLVITLMCFVAVYAEQNTYRAAVLEYSPLTDGATDLENWQENVREILHFIRDAANQKAHIIVLPEYALSGWNIDFKTLNTFSSEVPPPEKHVLPCTVYHTNNISSTLRDLSCAAQSNKIYVVANVIEKELDAVNNKQIYYNTNVVFNRKGEIIARYRKMNLYNEPYNANGNGLVTFTTDFGVNFGIIICADILFKVPSIEILLRYNVTDVIFSAAWFSELPFMQSLSIQHGYAKSNGINLLAAGMNDPKQSLGGSGIYLADGRISETFVSGISMSKLIVQDVPRVLTKLPNSSCQIQKSSGSYEWGVDPRTGNISGFHTIKEDMTNHTFKSLNLKEKSDILETICSGSSSFCCTFNISISRTHNVQPTYTYKLVAYQGTIQQGKVGTLGIRNCAIVACLNDDPHTCGARKAVPPKGVTFEKITITASIDNKEVRYQPSTVTFDLKPATDYSFCTVAHADEKVDISMTSTDSHDTLLTFGIMGRVYSYDNLPLGAINNAKKVTLDIFVLVVVAIVSTYMI